MFETLEMSVFPVMSIAGMILLVVYMLFDGLLDAIEFEVSEGLGFLNLMSILVFITMLGSAGWITYGYTDVTPTIALIVSLCSGLGLTIPVYLLTKLFKSQESSEAPSNKDFIGKSAEILLPASVLIEGQARVSVNNVIHDIPVRVSNDTSSDNRQFSKGEIVVINDMIGNVGVIA